MQGSETITTKTTPNPDEGGEQIANECQNETKYKFK